MADTVGSEQFIAVNGEFDPPGQQTELIPTPFKDGQAARKTHIRGEPVELEAVRDCATMAAGAALVLTYKAIEGTVVDIVQAGVTYQNQLVMSFRRKSLTCGAKGVGGLVDGKALLVMSLTVVDVNPP